MKKYLVIGNPIEHSLSPNIHNYWFDKNKINATYAKKLITNKDSNDKRLKETLDLEKQLQLAKKKADQDVLFYQENDDCPVCKQGLDAEHKKKHIAERKAKSTEITKAMSEITKTIDIKWI